MDPAQAVEQVSNVKLLCDVAVYGFVVLQTVARITKTTADDKIVTMFPKILNTIFLKSREKKGY